MSVSALNNEIEKASLSVSTDDFQMTIGEIVNLYRDGDLIINPNFQRFFRWDAGRKSRLIESILLGIPIPPVFIFERSDSKWELIDGLQRLSTILEFMGMLKRPDEDGIYKPLRLVGTQYLPSLNTSVWEEGFSEYYEGIEVSAFDSALQRSLKRSKIGIQILEKKSDDKSKFDLFQRLNSGGISANAQELRNCALIMSNEPFFDKVRGLVDNDNFKALIPLGEESRKKANDFEHICRIIAFGFHEYEQGTDIEDYVNRAMIDISLERQGEHDEICNRVSSTFHLIRSSLGNDGLRPYSDGTFHGRIGRTSVEIIFLGVLHNYEAIVALPGAQGFLDERAKAFWGTEDAGKFSAAGVSGTDRVARTIPFGRKWFDPNAPVPS